MNRFQLEQMLNGIRSDLQAAAEKLNNMFIDGNTTIKEREEQKALVKDLEDREAGVKAQLEKLDQEAAAKLKNNEPSATTEKDKTIENKAALIRAAMEGNKAGVTEALNNLGGKYNFNNALSTNPTTGNGGESFLPKTTSNEIITEPVYENDLRYHIIVTNESKLEIPRLIFTIDDDGFVLDDETAKEIKAQGDTVEFGRYKSKLKVNVSETLLLGTNTNLVATVDSGLAGAAAYKEAKQMFAKPSDSYYIKDHSFYAEDSSNNTLIKQVEGNSIFTAIKKSIANLPKLFRKNAKVIMRVEDYYDMIESLSNGNTSFYTMQPEMIFGRPIVFMDEATTPIVGDLRYLQINYDPQNLFDRDKDVDNGIEKFVNTNWYDIQFRLRSAFRLAKVTP